MFTFFFLSKVSYFPIFLTLQPAQYLDCGHLCTMLFLESSLILVVMNFFLYYM